MQIYNSDIQQYIGLVFMVKYYSLVALYSSM